MKAAIYLRQSVDVAGDELGVTRQREDCEALCVQRGWTVDTVIVDNDTSATRGTRRGFAQLLELIENRAVGAVVVWHQDRLARDLIDLERIISGCERTGTRLVTPAGDLDLSTDAGRLVARILGSVAKGEVERKSARQVRANRQRAELGLPPSGPVPFGFMPDRKSHHPEQAPAVRSAYSDLLAGSSLAGIAREWNAAGLASGKRRTGALDTGKPSKWSSETVRALLLNPRNAGLRAYKGELFPAVWEPIVPEETWRAAVDLLGDPSRRGAPPAAKHLLSGVALCALCGATVNAGTTRPTYHAYRCRRKLGHVARRGDKVDEFITDVVIERLSRSDAAKLLTPERPDVDVPALRAQATALRARLDTIAEEFADDDLVSPAQVRVMTRRVRDRLIDVERQLVEAGRVDVLAELIGVPDVYSAWVELESGKQRTVIDTLLWIVLRPVGQGARRFDPETVWMRWRVS